MNLVYCHKVMKRFGSSANRNTRLTTLYSNNGVVTYVQLCPIIHCIIHRLTKAYCIPTYQHIKAFWKILERVQLFFMLANIFIRVFFGFFFVNCIAMMKHSYFCSSFNLYFQINIQNFLIESFFLLQHSMQAFVMYLCSDTWRWRESDMLCKQSV